MNLLWFDPQTAKIHELTFHTKRFEEQQTKGKLKHVPTEFSANPTNNVNCYVNFVKQRIE